MNSVRIELWIVRVLLAFALDIAAAYLLAKLLDLGDTWGWLWALLGIWAAQFLIGAWRILHAVVGLFATQGIIHRGLTNGFTEAGLMRPVGFTDNPADLLSSIADDPEVALPQRISAAVFSGAIGASVQHYGLIPGLIFRSIATKALMALPRRY